LSEIAPILAHFALPNFRGACFYSRCHAGLAARHTTKFRGVIPLNDKVKRAHSLKFKASFGPFCKKNIVGKVCASRTSPCKKISGWSTS